MTREYQDVFKTGLRLGVSPGTVRNMVYEHRLESIRENGRIMVPVDATPTDGLVKKVDEMPDDTYMRGTLFCRQMKIAKDKFRWRVARGEYKDVVKYKQVIYIPVRYLEGRTPMTPESQKPKAPIMPEPFTTTVPIKCAMCAAPVANYEQTLVMGTRFQKIGTTCTYHRLFSKRCKEYRKLIHHRVSGGDGQSLYKLYRLISDQTICDIEARYKRG